MAYTIVYTYNSGKQNEVCLSPSHTIRIFKFIYKSLLKIHNHSTQNSTNSEKLNEIDIVYFIQLSFIITFNFIKRKEISSNVYIVSFLGTISSACENQQMFKNWALKPI